MFQSNAYRTELIKLPSESESLALARRLFVQAFRSDFSEPGFSLIAINAQISSIELRRFMVRLKEALSQVCFDQIQQFLGFRAMARFDQQTTTKFHRDGGPDESFLMLGYEPSEVHSDLAIADYTRASHDLGISPKEFEHDLNPMFRKGEQLLQDYITRLDDFVPKQSNILLINNSCQPFDRGRRHLLGVMHQATISQPDPSKRRLINSTMLRMAKSPDDEDVNKDQQHDYTVTIHISGSAYSS